MQLFWERLLRFSGTPSKNNIMTKLILFSLIFCSAASAQELVQGTQPAEQNIYISIDPLRYVNPFVGTGGHGHTFPGPVVPFGGVQPGPDTRYEGWDGCSGYHYSDSMIYGFSQTHLSGTGIPDYSDLLIVPQVGKLKTAGKFSDPKGYGAYFSHKDEIATPGFYQVALKDPAIKVRMTATQHCAIHEYDFSNAKGKRYLLLDLGYRDKVLSAGASVVGSRGVKGHRVSAAWAANQHFYFYLETGEDFTRSRVVMDEKSKKWYVALEFPEKVKTVMVKVGISGVDEEGAMNNYRVESRSWDFNHYLTEAQDAWRRELKQIAFRSSDETVTANFYTALYHAFVHPSIWSDADRRYRDFKGGISKAETDIYSVFSLWDTYRAADPLYNILCPGKVGSFVESFYRQYENTGLLPMWTLSNNETDCMIGYHAASVIQDARIKSGYGYDRKKLLDAMIATSNAPIYGRDDYRKNGFVSADKEPESVSKTLEYAYDDWCISQYAAEMGEKEIAEEYYRRSQSWKNLYNPESGFFQPRQSGMFLTNFRPEEVNHHFTEANAWQYSLAVQHQIDQLIALKGGKVAMENFLDSLFGSSSAMSGREQADITGLIGQYAHGNEPSHHMAYLYNYADAASKTQKLLDKIMRGEYRNAPDGLSGNEDCGQMSAWFVLSAMGFYPVCPGSESYAIGRPMMDTAVISSYGEKIVIIAKNNGPDAPYIQSMQWNGRPYEKLFITRDMIDAGGTLEITMGDKPSERVNGYATDVVHAAGKPAVTAPYIAAKSRVFAGTMRVEIEKLPLEDGKIVYTTDGSEPNAGSREYTEAFPLNETTTVKARIVRTEGGGIEMGPFVTTVFTKFVQNKKITLGPAYANQYSGGSEDALIDGQQGGSDYRSIGWQGFEGKDVVAVIELEEPAEISKVTVNALQDTKSWIFYPKGFTVEVSADGKSYKKAGSVKNTAVSDKQPGTVIAAMTADIPAVQAKFVRVTISNYGLCPDWHLGAGGRTWIFADEIKVE
jgi:predicted alpha-1,2-mannosidase